MTFELDVKKRQSEELSLRMTKIGFPSMQPGVSVACAAVQGAHGLFDLSSLNET